MSSNHPIKKWLNRYLGRPEILVLIVVLVCAYLIFSYLGGMLAPVFVSIVIAYLLQGPINLLERWKVPHLLSVLIIYLVFIGAIVFALIGFLPILSHQLDNLFQQWPHVVEKTQALLNTFSARYPDIISADKVEQTLDGLRSQSFSYAQKFLRFSLSSLTNLVGICVYFILVPLLVYFFLMDKTKLLKGFNSYLPRRRQLLNKVWGEVYEQMGNYVRGKALEAIIVAILFYIQFRIMHLPYASLFAVLVGLSVIIPYVGAVIVTIPIFVIAFLQWGSSAYFGYFVLIYAVLIAIDANVFVPLIFSEAVDLHPVSIILAILIFGGLFGFWGVFFAIPLASLVKAVAAAFQNDAASEFPHVEQKTTS